MKIDTAPTLTLLQDIMISTCNSAAPVTKIRARGRKVGKIENFSKGGGSKNLDLFVTNQAHISNF